MAAGITPKDIAERYGTTPKRVRQMAREESRHHRRWQRHVWTDWNDPELRQIVERLENGRGVERVRDWDVTISAKNQITLPVAALKKLRVKPGDKLRLMIKGHVLELLPHPVSWADYYAGIAPGLYGQTKEDIDAYIRELRGDWPPLND